LALLGGRGAVRAETLARWLHRRTRYRILAPRLADGSGKLRPMLVLANTAFQFTFGLGLTFLGIGVIVNVLIVYIAVQVMGERRQNEENRRHTYEA
jgi:hypothetical protein